MNKKSRKQKALKDKITVSLSKYKKAKETKVGGVFCCPSCKKLVKKTTYQKTFCSNKGRGNCKDKFWNLVDPEKRCRKTPYFYDVILEKHAKELGFPDYETMEKYSLDEDGSWEAHQCITDICDICKLKTDFCRCGEGVID